MVNTQGSADKNAQKFEKAKSLRPIDRKIC